MSEEWGRWIEHNGKGYPLRHGQYYQCVFSDGDEGATISGCGVPYYSKMGVSMTDYGPGSYCPSWEWADGWVPVIRYRVRRPKALQQLIQMVEKLPAPSKQYEDA